jgi:hypothetical protein
MTSIMQGNSSHREIQEDKIKDFLIETTLTSKCKDSQITIAIMVATSKQAGTVDQVKRKFSEA